MVPVKEESNKGQFGLPIKSVDELKDIDTVEKLTIYTDKKNQDTLENIIIKDSFSNLKSKIIIVKY